VDWRDNLSKFSKLWQSKKNIAKTNSIFPSLSIYHKVIILYNIPLKYILYIKLNYADIVYQMPETVGNTLHIQNSLNPYNNSMR
jgi:hypothetical protein